MKEIMKHVGIGSAMGYNNAIKLLNDACATMYSGKNALAKNLSFADIEGKIGGIYIFNGTGTLTNETVDIPVKNQTNTEEQAFLNGDKSALSIQDSFITTGPRVVSNGITLNTTFGRKYWKDIDESPYKTLLRCDTNTQAYWIASVSCDMDSIGPAFGVYGGFDSGIDCDWLYTSSGRR